MEYANKILCSVYRSDRKEGMYVYVPKSDGLETLPEALLAHFGPPVHVMDLLLHEQRPLARADVRLVMKQLKESGFFLQMPPSEGEQPLNPGMKRKQE